MPVTARLSKKFYDTFGDEIANEFVDWFNQVDATYRSEFRELFRTHFAQFDAKLEQRAAELHAKLEQRVAQLDARLEQRAAELREEIRTGLAIQGKELVRWMFLFWIGTLATLIALLKF